MSVCNGCQHDTVCRYKDQVQKYEERAERMDLCVPEPLSPEVVCRYKLLPSYSIPWTYPIPIYPTEPTWPQITWTTGSSVTGYPLPDGVIKCTA